MCRINMGWYKYVHIYIYICCWWIQHFGNMMSEVVALKSSLHRKINFFLLSHHHHPHIVSKDQQEKPSGGKSGNFWTYCSFKKKNKSVFAASNQKMSSALQPLPVRSAHVWKLCLLVCRRVRCCQQFECWNLSTQPTVCTKLCPLITFPFCNQRCRIRSGLAAAQTSDSD